MVGASACFASMGALVKWACEDLSSVTVVFGRSLVITVIALCLVLGRRQALRINNKPLMLWRCFIGFVAMLAYFYALGAIPLATAITLQYMNPIFVALFAGIAARERASVVNWIATVTAFVGAGLIVGPEVSTLGWGAAAAVFSAVGAAFAYLAIRRLRTTDSPEIIVLAFAVFATLFSAPALIVAERAPFGDELLALLGVGVFAFGGQLLITYAYRVARAPFVSAFSYSTILFGAIAGLLFFDEDLSFALVAGALMIIGAGVGLSLSELRKLAPYESD